MKSKIQKLIIELGENNPKITYFGLFGSFARNEDNENSDIDLLFDYDKSQKFSLLDQEGIKLSLENRLGINVDLISIDGLKASTKPEIYKDLETIYEKR